MGARSCWHPAIERPGLSFGDLIWRSRSATVAAGIEAGRRAATQLAAAVRAKVAVADVIAEDKHDVRLFATGTLRVLCCDAPDYPARIRSAPFSPIMITGQ